MNLEPPPLSRERQPVVTILSVAICICVTVAIYLNNVTSSPELAVRWGVSPGQAIYEGRWWVLITSAFIHVEILHLLFNMTWLWSLGGAFERVYGSLRLALFLVFAAFVSSGLQLLTGDAGIGMSGVVYALFGFAWVARRRIDIFAAMIDERTVQIMVGWAVLCIVLTYANIMHIANGAHFGGLLIGMALAATLYQPKYRWAAGAGAVLLVVASFIPLYWNPLSREKAFVDAKAASEGNDDAKAARLLKHALQMQAVQPVPGYRQLAVLSARLGDRAGFRDAIANLRQLDPEAADEMVAAFGADGVRP